MSISCYRKRLTALHRVPNSVSVERCTVSRDTHLEVERKVRSVLRNSSQVTVLVGSNSDDIARVVDNGSAWVFRRDAAAWTAEAQLRAANGTAGDFFGTSVALAEPVDAAGAIGPEGGLALCIAGGFGNRSSPPTVGPSPFCPIT